MILPYYTLTPEQVKIQAMVRELADTYIRPMAARIDEKDEYPWVSYRHLSEVKLGGIMIPKEYGGWGEGLLTAVLVQEELGRASGSVALVNTVPLLAGFAIIKYGTPEQKQSFLPHMVSGSKIFNFSLTEPGSGSDVAGMKTVALRDGDGYVMSGAKRYVGNAGIADYYGIYVKTDPAAGAKGISLFMVDKKTPGLTSPKAEAKLGLRGFIHGDIVMKNCRVPASGMIGKPGDGFLIAMKTLDPSRIVMSANATGLAQEAYEQALAYAKRRVTFGKPIIQHQAIAFMLADMALEVHTARLLTHHSARLMDQGVERFAKESAMAKLYTCDIVMKVADRAVTVFAAEGYTKGTDAGIERLFRDARSFQIMEGTAEIQRLVISRELMR
ncbi:MAG: acyl-CoA dehydrogenase family protein [Chloroflexota bacterium]